jgi:quercetin dioxygenase-like cupin family protein
MDLNAPYKSLGYYDVSKLERLVPGMDDPIWTKDTYRQIRYKEHSNTKSIIFVWEANHSEPTYMDTENCESELGVEVYKYVKHMLALYPDTYVSKVMLVALEPGGIIPVHSDGSHLAFVHRIHVPIKTTPRCHFEIDDAVYYFHEGEAFELNNTWNHAVYNKSSTFRVHLMIDLRKKNGNTNLS